MVENAFYGWYDDPQQPVDQPSYNPPLDAPCPFCGTAITAEDVRTHSIMMAGPSYAERSYFYRTHRTCSIRWPEVNMDSFIWDMIERNGD